MNNRKRKQKDMLPWKQDIILAAGCNIIALLICLLLFQPQSEAGDDMVMYSILAGGYGKRTCFIVYINIILSELLKILIQIVPTINWYIFAQYAAICVSLAVITWVLLKEFGRNMGLLISSVLILHFSYEGYVLYQFSKTAGILTSAGCFLLFYSLGRQKNKRLSVLVGGTLILIGFFYRFNMCLCVMAIFFVRGIYECIWLLRNNRKKAFHIIKKYIIVFGTIALMFLLTREVHDFFYYEDDGWAKYAEYNSYRSRIRDYPILEYSGNEGIYQQIGMSENDYQNLKTWNLADPDFYNIDLYQKIVAVTESAKTSSEKEKSSLLQGYLSYYSRKIMETMSFRIYLCLVLWLFVLAKSRKQTLLYAGLSCMGGIGITFYLYSQGRYGLNRIDMAVWLAVLLVFLSFYRENQIIIIEKNRRIPILLIGGLLLFGNMNAYLGHLRIFSGTYRDNRNMVKEFYDYVNADEDHVYFMEARTGYLGSGMDPLEAYPEGYDDNLLWLGGWYMESPVMKESWGKYGISNPFKDSIDNPSVYFVDRGNTIETTIITFIREHYAANASASLVKEFKDYQIYRIYTE